MYQTDWASLSLSAMLIMHIWASTEFYFRTKLLYNPEKFYIDADPQAPFEGCMGI